MALSKRRRRPLLLGTLAALAIAAGASGSTSAVTVQAVANSALGKTIVVDSGGFTLYHLTSEKKGSIACTGSCKKTWPPLLVAGSAKPVAGAGLSAGKLGTIKRPDAGVQVTYNGYALYRYRGDTKAGQVKGQGAEGLWYAVTPAGAVTKASASSAPAKTTTTTPGHTVTTTAGSPTAGSPTAGSPTAGGGTGGSTTVPSDGCLPGQTIIQGVGGDDDDDNESGPDDGDGCI